MWHTLLQASYVTARFNSKSFLYLSFKHIWTRKISHWLTVGGVKFDSSVNIVTRLQVGEPNNWSSIPRKPRDPKSPGVFADTSNLLFSNTEGFLPPGLKWKSSEDEHPAQSGTRLRTPTAVTSFLSEINTATRRVLRPNLKLMFKVHICWHWAHTMQNVYPELSLNCLVTLAKLRKATLRFFYVCLSVRMEQLFSHWTDFHEFWHLSMFSKMCRENSSFLKIPQE
jgi:hypothetical protein